MRAGSALQGRPLFCAPRMFGSLRVQVRSQPDLGDRLRGHHAREPGAFGIAPARFVKGIPVARAAALAYPSFDISAETLCQKILQWRRAQLPNGGCCWSARTWILPSDACTMWLATR